MSHSVNGKTDMNLKNTSEHKQSGTSYWMRNVSTKSAIRSSHVYKGRSRKADTLSRNPSHSRVLDGIKHQTEKGTQAGRLGSTARFVI
jgi:hypothetical protein